MKKIISLALSLILLTSTCCVFSTVANAKSLSHCEFKTIDHVEYFREIYSDGTSSDYSVGVFFDSVETGKTATEINIVSQIDGIPVTSLLGHSSYINCMQTEFGGYCCLNVKISDSNEFHERYNYVRGLGKKVKKINLPETIVGIRNNAFSKMTALESITLPAKIKNIPYALFSGCEKLKKVTFKGKIVSIEDCAFEDCKSLKSFKIPDTVKKIGSYAFAETGLTSITIPKKVSVDGEAFKRCESLKKVVFEGDKNSNRKINYLTFYGCKNLEKVYFPKKINRLNIERYAFANCEKLKKLYNISKLINIGIEAFKNCTSLESFTIPKGVDKIPKDAFYNCKKLSKVTIENTKKAPKITKKAFSKTKSGIKFYVKNKTVAKQLKKQLKGSGVKKAKIYVKTTKSKLIYKNVK